MNNTIDIRDVIVAHRGHWFDTASMRFFKTRLPHVAYRHADGRALFVSSEKGPNGVRAYSVRQQTADGTVSTVGEFMAYGTRAQAMRALNQELQTERIEA